MAFETAEIRSTLDAATPINGYRQDAAVGNVVALSLTNLVGTPSTFKWELIGRPAFSVAGGAGVNPWLLSISSTASFTVDGDAVARRDGSYIVRCTLNESSPTQRIIEAAICRVSGETIVGPAGDVDLRKPGPFETLLDTQAVAPANTGYAAQLEHWLEAVRGLLAAGPPGGSGDLNATYLAGSTAANQTLDLMDSDGGAFIVDGTDAGFTGPTSMRILNDAGRALDIENASGEAARIAAQTDLAASHVSFYVHDHLGADQKAGHVGSWVDVGEGTFDDAGLEFSSSAPYHFLDAFIGTLGSFGGTQFMHFGVTLDDVGPTGGSTIIAGGSLSTSDAMVILNNISLGRPTASNTYHPALNVGVSRVENTPPNAYSWRSIYFGDDGGTVTLTLEGASNPNMIGVQLAYVQAPSIAGQGGGAWTVAHASSFYISGPPTAGAGVTLTDVYAMFVASGLARFDGDGSGDVFEVPDDQGAVGATYGRIPIQVTGVGQKFIEIFS